MCAVFSMLPPVLPLLYLIYLLYQLASPPASGPLHWLSLFLLCLPFPALLHMSLQMSNQSTVVIRNKTPTKVSKLEK